MKTKKTKASEMMVKKEQEDIFRLAYEGCRIKAEMQILQEKLNSVTSEIEPLLSEKAKKESKLSTEIATALGIVKFKKTETPILDFENIDTFKKTLGKHFSRFFSKVRKVEESWKVDNRELKKVVFDADSEVGKQLREFVEIKCSNAVSFKPN